MSIAAKSKDESKAQKRSEEGKKVRTEQKSTVVTDGKGSAKSAKKSGFDSGGVAKTKRDGKTVAPSARGKAKSPEASQKKRKPRKEAVSAVKKKRKTAKAEPSVLEKCSVAGPKPAVAEAWSGPPDDKLEGGWPNGWVKKRMERATGVSKGKLDPYWYSPVTAKKFRSMAEVKRFLAFLGEAGGDEDAAWMLFKNKK